MGKGKRWEVGGGVWRKRERRALMYCMIDSFIHLFVWKECEAPRV
jgi:hypothetical protein